MLAIRTEQLRKVFGKVLALDGLNLSVEQGTVFGFLGPNGAGKTTTISMISGLIEPTRGDALIGGYSITRQPLQAKRSLGVVPQEIALYPTLVHARIWSSSDACTGWAARTSPSVSTGCSISWN